MNRANREKRVVEAALVIEYDGSEAVRIADRANRDVETDPERQQPQGAGVRVGRYWVMQRPQNKRVLGGRSKGQRP